MAFVTKRSKGKADGYFAGKDLTGYVAILFEPKEYVEKYGKFQNPVCFSRAFFFADEKDLEDGPSEVYENACIQAGVVAKNLEEYIGDQVVQKVVVGDQKDTTKNPPYVLRDVDEAIAEDVKKWYLAREEKKASAEVPDFLQ